MKNSKHGVDRCSQQDENREHMIARQQEKQESALERLELMRRQDCSDCYRLDKNPYENVNNRRINPLCRDAMCNWFVRVCDHFGMSHDLIAYAFAFLDRFAERSFDTFHGKTYYKLAAVTCLYLSIKTFNTTAISLESLAELSHGEFDATDMEVTEQAILSALGWRLNGPTVRTFIEELLIYIPISTVLYEDEAEEIRQLSLIFADLAVFDHRLVGESQLNVAIACVLNTVEGLRLRRSVLNMVISKIRCFLSVTLELSDAIDDIRSMLWESYDIRNNAEEEEEEQRAQGKQQKKAACMGDKQRDNNKVRDSSRLSPVSFVNCIR